MDAGGARSWVEEWAAEAAAERARSARRIREREAARRRRARWRRIERALLASGLLLVTYSAIVVLWAEPVTTAYAWLQQRHLAEAVDAGSLAYDDVEGPSEVAVAAERLQASLEAGQPLGHIRSAERELDAFFVHGTRSGSDLTKGAGHYPETSLPGRGTTFAVAGHRTTFGAPFRRINELERGDTIEVEVPYGSFRYRVFAHEIVAPDDWTVMRDRGFETLVLSSCHPVYSDAERWIVYARLVRVQPSGGDTYTPATLTASTPPPDRRG